MWFRSKKDFPKEVILLEKFQKEFEGLLSQMCYIAKSMYQNLLKDYQEVFAFFETLERSYLLEKYIIKNHLNKRTFQQYMYIVKNVEQIVRNHNDQYITLKLQQEKDYLDTILSQIDSHISLDEEQRRVVLNEEDYCLVIAGAGAGKTTTLAAKVKYLVEKKNVLPSEILVVSFTNKAVNELKEKIQKQLHIPANITTFHAIGYSIIKKEQEIKNIFNSENLYFVINEYFKKEILHDEETMKKLLLFFEEYFQIEKNHEFETLKSDPKFIEEQLHERNRRKITLNEEKVRSFEEAQIANFLYRNGIRYIYEPEYPYCLPKSKKIYTPDFLLIQGNRKVYLEHFGIHEDGTSNRYTSEELATYQKSIRDKIFLHKQHQTEMIYTFSQYKDGKSLLSHLKNLLIRTGFTFYPISSTELLRKLTNNENNSYMRRMVYLLADFLRNFKVNGYSYNDFERMSRETNNVRTKLFLEIARQCYLYYENFLQTNQMVDFESMINTSYSVLKTMKKNGKRLSFKYIIVDEYQDISRQRFDLTKALADVSDAKIMAVGDDWQTIYSFSGSDITLFTQFLSIMGYGDELLITNTYRNSQEVIDIAGNFIQKNQTQIHKKLISPKHIKNPIIILPYDNTRKDYKNKQNNGALFEFSKILVKTIELIEKFNKREGKRDLDILFLGRFNFDSRRIINNEYFYFDSKTGKVVCKLYPKYKITFMTAHSSKGLGYSNVIVLNGKNDTYGFPAKIEDDPVMNLVTKRDKSYEYAEERRLFYVALTRTRNRVFLICPNTNPSEFLLEIKRDYKNVVTLGKINENVLTSNKMICPLCGYPIYYSKKKNFNKKMYICTNDEEICGFVTNNLKGGKMGIEKCDKCITGYMLVRENRKDGTVFLGCSNFKKNGGCNNTISQKEYYLKYGYEFPKK